VQFLATFDAALLSNPLPADFASFAGTLSGLVSAFNLSPNSDPVRAAQAELGAVRDIMTQNVEQLLSRGERLDLLVDRTQDVAAQSHAFRRQATTVRRNMWWKNVKIMALAGAFLTVSAVLWCRRQWCSCTRRSCSSCCSSSGCIRGSRPASARGCRAGPICSCHAVLQCLYRHPLGASRSREEGRVVEHGHAAGFEPAAWLFPGIEPI
jgi:hypothetical protein